MESGSSGEQTSVVAAPGLRSVRRSECAKPEPKPRRKYQEMFLRKSLISTLISDNFILLFAQNKRPPGAMAESQSQRENCRRTSSVDPRRRVRLISLPKREIEPAPN
jgi:hypothetical protein